MPEYASNTHIRVDWSICGGHSLVRLSRWGVYVVSVCVHVPRAFSEQCSADLVGVGARRYHHLRGAEREGWGVLICSSHLTCFSHQHSTRPTVAIVSGGIVSRLRCFPHEGWVGSQGESGVSRAHRGEELRRALQGPTGQNFWKTWGER